MERYYRIEFTANLQKLTLAFKMECQIQVFWKRGQKVASTGKVPFKNCIAAFNQDLTISCNMAFDSQTKLFKDKQTKFAIVIYTQKGNKQAGQIIFNVAPFLNQKNKQKIYEVTLSKCPDKNAKLSFKLRAIIMQERSLDSLSQSSFATIDIQSLANKEKTENEQLPHLKKINMSPNKQLIQIPRAQSIVITSLKSKNKQKTAQIIPTTDRVKQKRNQVLNLPTTDKTSNTPENIKYKPEMIKNLQNQNKKIREQLKKKQALKKQNDELKRRLKDDDYESCKQYKKKIEQGKKQIQQLIQQSKGAKKVNDDIKKLQKQVLKCKQHIMRIFNEAERFGPDALEKIHQACGIREY